MVVSLRVIALIGSTGFNTAFKNEIRTFGCFSFPKIRLNTKSTLGNNKMGSVILINLSIFFRLKPLATKIKSIPRMIVVYLMYINYSIATPFFFE